MFSGSYMSEPFFFFLTSLSITSATCYLNSLLQSLFMTKPFRAAVYGWRYDKVAHGEPSKCIPLQLQSLFARLELSLQHAVSTKPLTSSFGWTGADAFTQHDVQVRTICKRLTTTFISLSSNPFAFAVKGTYVRSVRGA